MIFHIPVLVLACLALVPPTDRLSGFTFDQPVTVRVWGERDLKIDHVHFNNVLGCPPLDIRFQGYVYGSYSQRFW